MSLIDAARFDVENVCGNDYLYFLGERLAEEAKAQVEVVVSAPKSPKPSCEELAALVVGWVEVLETENRQVNRSA